VHPRGIRAVVSGSLSPERREGFAEGASHLGATGEHAFVNMRVPVWVLGDTLSLTRGVGSRT
jgi:hypothetical protein